MTRLGLLGGAERGDGRLEGSDAEGAEVGATPRWKQVDCLTCPHADVRLESPAGGALAAQRCRSLLRSPGPSAQVGEAAGGLLEEVLGDAAGREDGGGAEAV